MISESIYTFKLANRVDQNQKRKIPESDQGLHYFWKYQKNGNESINDWLS